MTLCKMRLWVGCMLTATAVASVATVALAGERVHFVEHPGQNEFSGRMIVRPFQDPVTDGDQIDSLLDSYRVLEHVWQTDEYIIEVPAGLTEDDVASRLMGTGQFEYAEPDWIVFPAVCPDDTRFGSQWHHRADRLQSCDGWDLWTGDANTSVGICDTGIETTHEDFQLNRLEGYNAVDRLWESQGGDIGPRNPHGTATTGCAAANGNNGKGVSGVGWNLSHRMLRVSNSSGGSSSIATLTHAVRTSIEAGDRAANVSYSGVDSSSSILTTATYVKSIGGLMVWAAGNEGRPLTRNDRDADDLIVAGGTDINDRKSGFSNYGPFVDIVAPATDVYTTKTGNSYGDASGTSFAAPLTAGLIGLTFSADPNLSPDQVELFLKLGVDDLGTNGVDDEFGYGRINVLQTLQLVGGDIPGCQDYKKFKAKCKGDGTVKVKVKLFDDSHNFETVTFRIDGTDYNAVILGNKAKMKICCLAGDVVTELVDPRGCFDPITVGCP